MFSKKEREFLEGKREQPKSYQRVLNYRIRRKLKQFFEVELPLLQRRGITKFYNGITENNNGQENILLTQRRVTGLEGQRTTRLYYDRLREQTL